MKKLLSELANWRFSFVTTVFNFVTQTFSDTKYISFRHLLTFHKLPNLKSPKLFNDKIHWRMLNDRKSIYKEVTDKLAMREYVKRIGLQEYLPKLIFVTSEPHLIPFSTFPDAFVVKANHGSGMTIPILDKRTIELEKMYKIFHMWLKTDYYYRAREWQYHDLTPKIMVEEYLGEGESGPTEYKLYCFDGEPRVIVVIKNRFSPTKKKGRYDLDWVSLDFPGSEKISDDFRKPAKFNQLIEAARLFSSGFDFIRVDTYIAKERIVLGELTLSPFAGFGRLSIEHQSYLGDLWN